MSPLRWMFLLMGSAGLLSFALWVYLRREFPVQARTMLAALRALALFGVLALLINPRIPIGSEGDQGGPWILLDASVSMRAGSGTGSAWDRGVTEVSGAADGERPFLLFGDRVDRISVDTLAGLTPAGAETRLAPALRLAVELGAQSVRIVTDGRFGDVTEVAEVLASSGLPAQWTDVGADATHAGLLAASMPKSLAALDTASVAVTVFGENGDSVGVTVVLEGWDSATAVVPLSAPGRTVRADVAIPLPPDSGRYRLRVRLDPAGNFSRGTDPFPNDDSLSFEVDVGRPRGGVILVSTRPGWEARRLLPALVRSSGLTGRGYVSMSDGRFLTLETDQNAPRVVTSDAVRDAMQAAELLVLEGVDAESPEWLRGAISASVPRLFLAASPDEAAFAGVRAGRPLAGEWYVRSDPPGSPLLSALMGADWSGMPPVSDPLPLLSQAEILEVGSLIPVLDIARAGGGAPTTALLLIEGSEPRAAVALAAGYWRWDVREGSSRGAYAQLWSGVAGWLLETERGTVAPEGVPTAENETSPQGFPPVDMRYPRVDLSRFSDGVARGAGGSGGGRPLRHFPLPYLLVIVLLCTEWVLRRREGLR